MDNTTENEKNDLHGHPAILVTRYMVGVVGILANLLVVVVFNFKNFHKKSSTHLLIYHQSWVDMAGSLAFIIYYTRDPPAGVSGDVFCKTRAIFWHLLYVSTNNLVLVTIERYIAVLHSNWYRMKFSRRRRKGTILLIPHAISLMMSLYLAIAAKVDQERPWLCEYNVSTRIIEILSGVLVFLFCWFIPTTLMIFCYARIFKMIKGKAKIESAHSQSNISRTVQPMSESRPRSGAYSKAQRNLIITLFCVFISFIICITPNFALYLVYAICSCFNFNSNPLHEITVTLLAVNLCVNPFIYAFKFNDLRKGLKNLKIALLMNVGVEVSDVQYTESTADHSDTK